jgi:hypothetical protein
MTEVAKAFSRVVACPECHAYCGWCSWYVKNAREAGCGSQWRKPKDCQFEKFKGTACQTCGGTEKVRLVGHYERVVPPVAGVEGQTTTTKGEV